METTVTPIVRELLRALPREGVERELTLRRAAELEAEAEASTALRTAALRAHDARRGSDAPAAQRLADVLSAASALWSHNDVVASVDAPGARLALRQELASAPFLRMVPEWIAELREIASTAPRSGACTVASGMQLWLWTMSYFRDAADRRDVAVAQLAESFCALIAARCLIVSVARDPLPGASELRQDLCHVQAARAAGQVSTLCAELVHGYRQHPAWDAEGCAGCYGADELDELEGLMPGIASTARAHSDVIELDGSHPAKAGPCVRFNDIEGFTRLRAKLDGCLTGSRLASDRAAALLAASFSPAPAGVRS